MVIAFTRSLAGIPTVRTAAPRRPLRTVIKTLRCAAGLVTVGELCCIDLAYVVVKVICEQRDVIPKALGHSIHG